jgi:hypothetical protein
VSFADLDPSCRATAEDIVNAGQYAIEQNKKSMIPEDYFIISGTFIQRLVNVLGEQPFKTAYPLIKILNNLEEVEK